MYKLFFDDIEEIFLRQTSWKLFSILILFILIIACLIVRSVSRQKNEFVSVCVAPLIYALLFYDVIQLFSVLLLKLNLTERYFNRFCRWSYYLKSSSESGQCLTLIFLLAFVRHHLRYNQAHKRLSTDCRIYCQLSNFVCLLFIIYMHNWITHLKVEKLHSISLNSTDFEIHIEQMSLAIFEQPEMNEQVYQRFIADFEKYSRVREKSNKTDNFYSNLHDTSSNQIWIRIDLDGILKNDSNPINRNISNKENHDEIHQFYRMARCTYSQEHVLLSNAMTFIQSIIYLLLILYHFIIILTYRDPLATVLCDQDIYRNSLNFARNSIFESSRPSTIFLDLKRFFIFIICSQTFFTCLHLIYNCALTLLLTFDETPLKLLIIRWLFAFLFKFHYFSIPVRISILFIYFLFNQFSNEFRSLRSYVSNTKLRFSWKIQKPRVCFQFRMVPYEKNFHRPPLITKEFSSNINDDQSSIVPRDSFLIVEENHYSNNDKTFCRNQFSVTRL